MAANEGSSSAARDTGNETRSGDGAAAPAARGTGIAASAEEEITFAEQWVGYDTVDEALLESVRTLPHPPTWNDWQPAAKAIRRSNRVSGFLGVQYDFHGFCSH